MSPLRTLDQSSKLKDVLYEIRGQALVEADRLESEGHTILKLNTGNPAVFGFEAPFQIVRDMIEAVPHAHGYSDSRGIMAARRAVVYRYEQDETFPPFGPDDVYLGNGVSELITMVMQALLDEGDEVLIPAPDYPLWTAMTSLGGGTPVHYLSEERNGWQPDLEDIRSKVTPRTKAIVVINPNNPTGAVYSKEVLEGLLDLARRHGLMVMADEIYDQVLYDDAVHHDIASLAEDLVVLTFCGLSKTHRVAGFRSGWLVVTGPRQHARDYLEGLAMLASMRLCANTPAQYAIQAALGGRQTIHELTAPGGRLREQRDTAWKALNAIPGVSCVQPRGALYAFPRLDPEVYPIRDDERFVLDLLREEKIQVVQGTGFNWPTPDHFRILTLPHAATLEDAIGRIGRFLETYRQG
jgi:alanine-synthesizing transaminase